MENHDFCVGQTVTAARFGPPLLVIWIEADWIVCWDAKAAREYRYRPSQLTRAVNEKG